MTNLKTKLTKALKKLLNYRRTLLPVGRTEFNEWAQDILTTYDIPNNDSMVWAMTHLVMTSKTPLVSKREMFLSLRKAMANEVAGTIFQEIKLKQMAEQARAKEEEQKKLEATNLKVVSNGTQEKTSTSI